MIHDVSPQPNRKITAAQIETDCPGDLQDLAKHINTHLDKARKYQDKADQHDRRLELSHLETRSRRFVVVAYSGIAALCRHRLCVALMLGAGLGTEAGRAGL
jgi:hypothetical protein